MRPSLWHSFKSLDKDVEPEQAGPVLAKARDRAKVKGRAVEREGTRAMPKRAHQVEIDQSDLPKTRATSASSSSR